MWYSYIKTNPCSVWTHSKKPATQTKGNESGYENFFEDHESYSRRWFTFGCPQMRNRSFNDQEILKQKYDAIEWNNCFKDSIIIHSTRSFVLTRKFSVWKSRSTNKMIAFMRSHPKMLEINSPEFSEATTQKVLRSGRASLTTLLYPSISMKKGVKTSDTIYWNMLDKVVEPLNETLFDGEHWCSNKTPPLDMELVPPKNG